MRSSSGTIFRAGKAAIFGGRGAYMEDHVAQAIEKAYPDRAVAIWKGLAEGQIALTKPAGLCCGDTLSEKTLATS